MEEEWKKGVLLLHLILVDCSVYSYPFYFSIPYSMVCRNDLPNTIPYISLPYYFTTATIKW